MKRLLVPVLMVNALLLGVRAWQAFPVAQGGGAAATDERFCADSNGDGGVDMSDALTILNYLFTGQGGPPSYLSRHVVENRASSRQWRVSEVAWIGALSAECRRR